MEERPVVTVTKHGLVFDPQIISGRLFMHFPPSYRVRVSLRELTLFLLELTGKWQLKASKQLSF